MTITYDSLVDAMYIKIKTRAKIARTLEFAPETYVDLDAKGELIGVEMLSPGQRVLKRVGKKYHHPELSRIQVNKLQESLAA